MYGFRASLCVQGAQARNNEIRFGTRGAVSVYMSIDSRLCDGVTYCRQGIVVPKHVRGFDILSLICGGL